VKGGLRSGVHPGIRGGSGSGRRGRPSRAEEIEAGVRCECGTLVDRHPPLPRPLPWNHGRPCSREPKVSMWTLTR
jgi:hypothetical protein